MSWYTIIYPEGEFEETNVEVLNEQIEKSKPSGIVSPKGIRDKWCNAATRQSW